VADDDQSKQGIVITDAWMEELMKHPYHSSKYVALTLVEKPGTAIFLMKERAKVYKSQGSRLKHELSKRLSTEESKHSDGLDDNSGALKRKKAADGSAVLIPPSSQQPAFGPRNTK